MEIKQWTIEQWMGTVLRKTKTEKFTILESNENYSTPYQNLWDTMKAVLKGEF